ncbi:tape measure protein [Myroides odoratus]|uniref:Tape measure protein n=1 Tax=Myroides odoratus TaxID=256 RepID=A0A9Q7EBQ2_MYROD|nr:tape measure protein [Myroides odoratus]EHQ43465.1 phage tape measure protein [Myroides odoratus DSM 2801]EKB06132.1 tape measure domain-containing protein [Myroides odoratus CIP 103059]QQU00800.1 tape measure protein [Myroides odoratus]WQD56959.1 tape measure protein [Myroides odoratus]STZ30744.1 tape measure domain [Myroides odoratus]
MANLSEYIEEARENTFSGMQRLGADRLNSTNARQGEGHDSIQESQQLRQTGATLNVLKERQGKLKNERALVNSKDLTTLRAYNDEVNALEKQISKLENITSENKLGAWFKKTFNESSFGKMLNNPLLLLQRTLSAGMENDSYKVSFEVLLHSEKAAKKMMQDLSGIKMDQGALSGAAEGMLRQGVDQKDVTPLLSSMGDISGGDGESLGRLAAAYTQVNNEGKLLSGTLNQLIGAGFNPLLQMSQSTGKSMEELKAEMDQGLISTDRLKQAFFDATGEGGQFHNMLEKQADTLGGKWEDFMRKINGGLLQLYIVIGPVVEKLVEFGGAAFDAVANGLGWLVNKIEEGNPLVLGFALAVGAVMLALAVMKTGMFLAAIGQAALTTVTNLSSLAWWKLNAAMLANPITLFIAAFIFVISLVASAIYYFDTWGSTILTMLGPVGTLINAIVLIGRHWDSITEAFKSDGILGGFKRIGQVLLDTLLHPIQRVLGWIGELTDWDWAKNAGKEVEELRKKWDLVTPEETEEKAGMLNDIKLKMGFGDNALLKEITDQQTFGIADTKGTPGTQQIDTSINTSQGAQNNSNAAATTANGGTKHNYITISLNDLIGVVNINKAGFQESVEDMEGEVTDALLRLLGSAVNAGN